MISIHDCKELLPRPIDLRVYLQLGQEAPLIMEASWGFEKEDGSAPERYVFAQPLIPREGATLRALINIRRRYAKAYSAYYEENVDDGS